MELPGTAMSLSSNRTGDTVTVAISGELDLGTCAAVDAAIVDAVDAPGVAEVRVDLSALTFMDSSGISLLLKGRRRADERGVAYWVAGVRGTPRQVLEITGVLSHLTGGGADAGGEADAGGTSGTGGAGGTGGTGGAGGTGGTGGAGGIPGQRPAGA